MSYSTQAVVEHHLQAFNEGIDSIMEDFIEESVVITKDATYRGIAEIHAFFTELVNGLPEDFEDAVIMRRQEVQGEVAFLLWDAKPWFTFCTDTLVTRNGKILYHNFAAQAG